MEYTVAAVVLATAVLIWWAMTAQRFSTQANIRKTQASRKMRAVEPSPIAKTGGSKGKQGFGRR